MLKTFKYRLFTNQTQESRLDALFGSTRYLYNCALEHRIVNWNQWRKSVYYFDQTAALKEIREFDSGIANLNFTAAQQILRRLDIAFKAFFERIKKGDTPGFPRFKGKHRFRSIPYRYGDGCRLKNGKLYIQNVGSVRIKLHRDIEGCIKTVMIKRKNGRYYAAFSCDDVPEKPLPPNFKQIGIDVGIKTFAATSDGELIDNPKHLKQSEEKLKATQQKHSKKRTAKTRKTLARLHEKVSNQRKDFLHKLSRQLIVLFGVIFVEDLSPKQMVEDNSKTLNKYINDAAWSTFFDMLTYKAVEAGRKVIKVNPKGTTQTCSGCGKIVSKDLSVRVHACSCGLKLDRDINAAVNILRVGQTLYA